MYALTYNRYYQWDLILCNLCPHPFCLQMWDLSTAIEIANKGEDGMFSVTYLFVKVSSSEQERISYKDTGTQ